MIFDQIREKLKKGKLFSILIDPESYTLSTIDGLARYIDPGVVDFILVGGSLVSGQLDPVIEKIKAVLQLPVILFPGSIYQLSGKADAVLLLSLISGRNPELLIGNHVVAAPIIKNLGIEAISTGYILIGDGKTSSVEYMSNTLPIPADKPEIVVATALAGQYLGQQMIYLEHGSGAEHPISTEVVAAVKREINIPLIVGGGIQTPGEAKNLYDAGADILVVGNRIEKDPAFISRMAVLR
ncbi:MAG: geranylgeranylglyceryl/heptaprenylglyceryl phosphate synthase [Chlorobi bacterium]|nr:geranylgeranylglyceryl/heptaprenylglyceryl phosphate synthase [Chlorobiota bacterium]